MSQWDNAGPQKAAQSQSIVGSLDGDPIPVALKGTASSGSAIDVALTPKGGIVTGNVTTKFRDAFEDYVPNIVGGKYTEQKATGDVIRKDGNTASASYLVISKSPWNTGSESIVETVQSFALPLELSIGAHRSQATIGQEFSIEVVDTDTPLPTYTEVAVSSMSQSTTTLTVNTATAHGLSVGMSIGIYGCADSRFNYGSVVVASVPSTTQFTVAAGPAGTIQSLTASPAVLGSPFVYVRRRLGGANDGTSMIFENASATNASFYVRSESGDAFPSGTIAGNHSAAVATTASVQLVNTAYAYAFTPTSEYRLNLASDRVQWHDSAVDVASGTTQRVLRTSVCPSLDKAYKLRIRATNNKGLAAPVGKIVSAVKTGTTTATVTFAAAHGLTVNDYVTIYGARDTTNFPNITTATQVASVVNATTITIVWGAAVTATTYGGYVARAQGGQVVQGVIAQVGASVSVTNSIVTLVGSAAWSGLSFGDSVELIGVRESVAGADLLLDGAYAVRNVSTTALELEALPGTTPPTTLVSTNCGGGVIKRTDFRVSFIRVFDYERERVEFTPRPQSDLTIALPVQVANTQINVQGAQGNNSNTVPQPVLTSIVGVSANPTAGTTARQQQAIGTLIGVPIMKPFSIPEADWQTPSNIGGIVNTATPLQVKEAAGAGIRNYVTSVDLVAEALTNATDLRIREPDLTCSSQTIASNTLTVSATHNLSVGDAVVFTASTVTGITAGVTYYVLTTPAATTLTLSATRGGSTLTISGTGVTATFHKVLWQTRIPTAGRPAGQLIFNTPLRGSPNTLLQVQTATASGAGAVYANLQGFTAP